MSQGCFFQPTHSVELEASGGRVLSPPHPPPPGGSHCLLENRRFSPSAFFDGPQKSDSCFSQEHLLVRSSIVRRWNDPESPLGDECVSFNEKMEKIRLRGR